MRKKKKKKVGFLDKWKRDIKKTSSRRKKRSQTEEKIIEHLTSNIPQKRKLSLPHVDDVTSPYLDIQQNDKPPQVKQKPVLSKSQSYFRLSNSSITNTVNVTTTQNTK